METIVSLDITPVLFGFKTSFEVWKPAPDGTTFDDPRVDLKLPLRYGNLLPLLLPSKYDFRFKTSFEVWKQLRALQMHAAFIRFKTSFEVWKLVFEIPMMSSLCRFKTSFEVWKLARDPLVLVAVGDLKLPLRYGNCTSMCC